MSHARVWDDLARHLACRYHVVALDQRGHGDSQWSGELAYSIDDHFADIARFVDTCRLGRPILVGHSMGGRNALLYAACAPERVERLVLIDSRPDSDPDSSQALRHLLEALPLEADCLDQVAEVIGRLYPLIPWDVALHIACHGYRRYSCGKLVPKYDLRMGEWTGRSGYVAEELWMFLDHVSCPTLVVRGEKSPFLSTASARRMGRLLPRGSLVEIPDSTHMPVHENPAVFRRELHTFLKP